MGVSTKIGARVFHVAVSITAIYGADSSDMYSRVSSGDHAISCGAGPTAIFAVTVSVCVS